MLTVYGRTSSINVQKVMWLVGELGLEHTHVPRGGSFGGLDSAEFRAMNPAGLVPVIDDAGTHVWESHAILRYLAASRGAARFWPSDPRARAALDPWVDWAQTRLQPDFNTGVFWGAYRTPEAKRDLRAIERALKATVEDMALLDGALSTREYLSGEQLGLADIPAGVQLYRYFTLEIERPSLPNLERWYERLQSREAYRKHVMVDYSELRNRLAF